MNDQGAQERKKKLANWLHKQGFPLEMRTARYFLSRGWTVNHSRMYEDPLTKKDREIDLLAWDDDAGQDTGESERSVFGTAVIECKSASPDRPWLLFPSTAYTITAYGHFMTTPRGEEVGPLIAHLDESNVDELNVLARAGTLAAHDAGPAKIIV